MDIDLSLILGPIVLGVVFNAAVYGACVVQWYTYYTSGYNDPWYTRLLVAWVCILDTLHTAALIYMLWDCVVPNFGNHAIFLHLPWPYSTTPIFITLASVPIQIFLAYRIKCLSHSVLLFIGISALSLAQGVCGIVSGVLTASNQDPLSNASVIPLTTSWISITVFVDVCITLLLLYYLRKSRTGFKRTDNVIERLIRTAIETASIGAIFCVIDIIVFLTHINTNIETFFALPLGRIYTNTLMLTLNSRASLREDLSSGTVHSFNVAGSGSGGGRRKMEVSVDISQSIQMDRIQSDRVHHQASYDDQKIATVA